MANHRRTEETFVPSVYSTGVTGYGVATDVRAEQQEPTVSGWLDWLWGGFEKEDRKVTTSPYQYYVDAKGNIVAAGTPGGRWVGCEEYAKIHNLRSCTDDLVVARNIERANAEDVLADVVDVVAPEADTTPDKPVPWGKVALVVGVAAIFVVGVQYLPKAKD
jgi:hypothetical protein